MSDNKIDNLMKNVTMSDDLKDSIRNNTVNNQKVVSIRKRPVKRLILVATLCVAALGTLTVTAANVSGKWQKYLADIFGVDEKQQQELLNDGYAQDKEVSRHENDILSVTQNGMTMTVKQTILDKNTLVILLHAKSENGMKLDDNCVLGDVSIDGVSNDGMYYFGSGEAVENSPYEKWYVITYSCTSHMEDIENGSIIGLTVKNLTSIASDEEILVEGEWKLSWQLDVNASVVEVPVNQTIEAKGCRYYVGSLEISPMSVKVKYTQSREVLEGKIEGTDDKVYYIDGDKDGDIFSIDEENSDNVEYMDGFITYYNPETGLTELTYAGLDIDFVMKDGTIYENLTGHSGGTCLGDEESSEMDVWTLSQIIDIDELKSVIIEGKEFLVN